MVALLSLASSVIWGGADFLGGLLSRTRSAYAVVAASQAWGLVAIALWALVTWQYGADPAYLPWALMAGACGAVGLVCYYAALASGTVGVVAPIASMGAVVPVVLGVAGGDRPSPVQVVGIVLAMVGVVAASGPELSGGGKPLPVLLAAVAGLGFGFALYAIGRGSQVNGVMTLVAMRVSTVVPFLLLARFVLAERLRRVQQVGIVGALAGVAMLSAG